VKEAAEERVISSVKSKCEGHRVQGGWGAWVGSERESEKRGTRVRSRAGVEG